MQHHRPALAIRHASHVTTQNLIRIRHTLAHVAALSTTPKAVR